MRMEVRNLEKEGLKLPRFCALKPITTLRNGLHSSPGATSSQ